MKYIWVFMFAALSLRAVEKNESSIDRSAVRKVIKNHLLEFKKCYELEFKTKPDLEGKVVVDLAVSDKGNVLKTKIVSTQLNNLNVENCLLDVFKTLKFPNAPNGTVVEVRYPFLFKNKE